MKLYKRPTNLLGLIMVSSISLTACESFPTRFHVGPKLGIKIPIEDRSAEDYIKPEDAEEEEPKFTQLINDDDSDTKIKPIEKQNFLGSGQFISKKSGGSSHQKGSTGKYSLNFDAADLGEVAKIILTDMLQENYVMSPKVGGSVTLQTTAPLHKDELLTTLEMLLRINGAVLIKRDGIYRIETDADSLRIADTSSVGGKKIKAGYQIRVVPLKYVGAADMSEIIKPILPKSIIKVDPARNILLVAGTRGEINKVIDLIDTFDINFIDGMSFGLYPLENTDVSSTIEQIENIFDKGQKTPLSGMLRFINIKHLNAILVITQQKEYLKEAEKWIARLDIESTGIGEGGVIVYRVQHVDAVELASTLTQVVSGIASSSNKPASVAPGRKITSITNKKRRPVSRTNNRRSGQGNASLEGVGIIADEVNNALIITAQPQQYKMLNKIIKQLDVMPLQVLIDATIISVNLSDNLSHGVRWAFDNKIEGGSTGITKGSGVQGPNLDFGSLASVATSAILGGFTYGVVSNDGAIKMALNLLANDNKTHVISSPSVMVLNNHEAKLTIGDQIPIRTSETTNSTGVLTSSPIQMMDTGVSLTVKPRVNANGVVIMEIDQKVNDVKGAGGSSDIDSPTILKREITSSVAVVSGESVVLGGLMNETHNDGTTGIPILKDIPYLGWLFGTTTKTLTKQELVVIITPRVIENKFDARKVTDEYKRKLTGIFYDQKNYRPRGDEILRGYNGRPVESNKTRTTWPD